MERRFNPQNGVKVEKRSDGSRMIVGYAAVFYDGTSRTEYELWNFGNERCVERIMPGCYDRAIREDDIRGLRNHDHDVVLGRNTAGTMRLSQDKIGLRYEIDVPDTQDGKDTVTSIERGDISGSSFSFRADEQKWTDTKNGDNLFTVRELCSVGLFDVGPVTYPAYEATTAGVRDTSNVNEARSAFEAWRKSAFRPTPRSVVIARARTLSL